MNEHWQEQLKHQLDKDYPRWYIEWASDTELAAAIRDGNKGRLKDSVAARLLHPILHAAIGAGLVEEVRPPRPEPQDPIWKNS